jgi:hypothetical protein
MIVTISGSALPPVCRRGAVRVSGPVRKKSLVLDRTPTRRKLATQVFTDGEIRLDPPGISVSLAALYAD